MAGNWPARTLFARSRQITRVHLPSTSYSTSSTSTSSLLHPPPSFLLLARHCTFHLALPGQLCRNLVVVSRSIHLSSSPILPSFSPLPSSSTSLLSRPIHLLASFPILPSPSQRHPSPVSFASFSTSPLTLKIKPKGDDGTPQRKKYSSPIITLIDTEDKVSTVALDKAQRQAKRQDLKVVKIEDPSMKGGKEVYRLLTGKQYFEEQKKAKSEKKSSTGTKDEKIMTIGGNISSHDLGVKLHSVTKWLSKGHQIKVTISGRKSTKENVENVFTTMEEEAKKVNGRILQRHEKIDDIRFYIAPPKDKECGAASSEATQPDDHGQSDESSDTIKA